MYRQARSFAQQVSPKPCPEIHEKGEFHAAVMFHLRSPFLTEAVEFQPGHFRVEPGGSESACARLPYREAPMGYLRYRLWNLLLLCPPVHLASFFSPFQFLFSISQYSKLTYAL
jgi:hypothetical protein